jgi:uncharacterized cupin superfamily protein
MTIFQSSTSAFQDIASTGLLEPPTATPLSGDIRTWASELFAHSNNGSSTGFWKASVGRSHWNFEDYNEVIFILEGQLSVTEEGGERVQLGPGDVAVFPVGWKGEWDVVEELKKFYVVFP